AFRGAHAPSRADASPAPDFGASPNGGLETFAARAPRTLVDRALRARLKRALAAASRLRSRFTSRSHLHEFNGRPVRIANIDDAFARIRSGCERLRFTSGFPTGRGDLL